MDEGYGRDVLARPALDRLRDLVEQGELDRVYVQSSDRLVSGAKSVFLVEELQKHGVEVVFLKGAVEDTPEGKLLLHLQGAMAEFERAKIEERTRRGKLFWARQGALVGGHAPYGYRFIRRTDNERARLEVDEDKASIVRGMYRWIADEELSLRAVAKRLTEYGQPTARGARYWRPTAVARIIENPVYKGTVYYQRYESVLPATRLTDDPYRQTKKTARKPRPESDWIGIPVPTIVEESLWERTQLQLQANSVYSRRNNKRHSYLLRSLIRCSHCGSTFSGQAMRGTRYYRCTSKHSKLTPYEPRCRVRSVRAEPVEQAVWSAVSDALKQPQALVTEYERRIESGVSGDFEADRKTISLAIKRMKAQEDRITDAYVNEAMDLVRYKAEMNKLKGRRQLLDREAKDLKTRVRHESDTRDALRHLEQFCQRVSEGLDQLTFEEHQRLLRLVVERVTLTENNVRVETIIPNKGDADHLRTLRGEPFDGLRTGLSNHASAFRLLLQSPSRGSPRFSIR